MKIYGEAIKDLDRAIQLDPQRTDAFIERGMIRADQDEHDKAIADFTQAIKLDHQNSKAYTLRGRAEEQEGVPRSPGGLQRGRRDDAGQP